MPTRCLYPVSENESIECCRSGSAAMVESYADSYRGGAAPTHKVKNTSLLTQHSALSTQHSALSTQHSALSTQHSAQHTRTRVKFQIQIRQPHSVDDLDCLVAQHISQTTQ